MCRRFNSAPRHPGRAVRGRGATGRAAQGCWVERLLPPVPEPPDASRRRSKLPRAPAARFGEFRSGVVVFVKGGVPPFTLSPRSGGQRTGGSLPLFFSRNAGSCAHCERRAGNADGARRAAQRSGGSLLSFTNADLRSARCAQRSEAADRSSLSRHAGQGTPTSGRHRCAQRSEAADRSSLSRHAGQGTPTSTLRAAQQRRIAPLLHDTPGRERRPPVGTLRAAQRSGRIAPLLHDTPGRERRPPVGTLRAAQQRRIAPLFHDMPGRERRPLVTAARSAATTDRSSPSRDAGQGTPTSGRHRCAQRSEATDRSSLSRHAGQGTPTSGRHAARSAAKGVYHAAGMTLNTEVPAEKGPPRTWGSFPPPAFGGLCRAPPGELSAFPCLRAALPGGMGAETCTTRN